ncbi:hypothetical protein CLV92_102190 [Kineococcus xinjiangensis]|uniref:Uncharacterized protein n=1 Tax=Kineococcus xinjiangensis TaxID=512762 RepID=A0A2S6IUT7_9ACTN|nr:hypothetical protein [Kineococcus xinjiangensis]PPK98037.1 hypothetical protein CLV92_102190 [Kineococcus xinjiangensis]
MTSMRWLLAVLNPHSVAPDAAYYDAIYTDAPAVLAGMLVGERLNEEDIAAKFSEHSDILIELRRMLGPASNASAIDRFERLVYEFDAGDSRLAASVLVAAVCLSDRDEQHRALMLLDHAISVLSRSDDFTARLSRTALLFQRAFRLWEMNEDWVNGFTEGLSALDRLSDDARSMEWESFPVQSESVIDLLDALRWSGEISLRMRDDIAFSDHPQTQMPVPTLTEHATKLATRGYASFVDELFRNTAAPQTGVSWRRDPIDTPFWEALWHFELLGNIRLACLYRERLAKLRLLRGQGAAVGGVYYDVIRLLRHAERMKELDQALRYVRENGPLAELAENARRVISRGRHFRRHGDADLSVLRAGASLLDVESAAEGYEQVVASLQLTPKDRRTFTHRSVRLERLWSAAVGLALTSNRLDHFLSDFLAHVSGLPQSDELLDRSYARIVHGLDWDGVPTGIQSTWRDWSQGQGVTWPQLSSAVSVALGGFEVTSAAGELTVGSIAQEVNDAMAGRLPTWSPSEVSARRNLISDRLAAIRQDAANRSYAVGSFDPCDIAVGLAIYCDVSELWSPITSFLSDPLVARQDKGAALNRLSRAAGSIPQEVLDALRENYDIVLSGGFSGPFRAQVNPFPEAVRAAAVLGLRSLDESLTDVSRLLSGSSPLARIEGARTLATMARFLQPIPDWVPALALQMTRDTSGQVKGYASSALASMLAERGPLHVSLKLRLLEMMGEDGMASPLLTLGGMQGVDALPGDVYERIESIAARHLAREVRSAAEAVLKSCVPLPAEG